MTEHTIENFEYFSEKPDLYKKDMQALNALTSIWKNNGRLPNGEKVSIEKTLSDDAAHTLMMRKAYSTDNYTSDHPMLTARVIQDVALEAIEPTAVLEPLFETILVDHYGPNIILPSWGGMGSAADIPEGEAFPEQSLDLAGYSKATIGKVGIAAKISDLLIRFNQYDLIGLHIRAATSAIHRKKESKLAAAISQYGTVVFDNDDATVLSTNGRNASGFRNGTLSLDDIYETQDRLLVDGFQPNTLIVHPRAWVIFSEKSLSDVFGLQRGTAWKFDPNPKIRGTQQARTTQVSSSFPSDWNIVVSPYVAFNSTSGSAHPLTDIIMCDSNALGVILDTGGGIQTEEFRDIRDLRIINLRERYGISIVNDGDGIGLIKNVSVSRGTDFVARLVSNIPEVNMNLSGDIDHKAVTTGTR